MLDFYFGEHPSYGHRLEAKVDNGYYYIYIIYDKNNVVMFKYRGCIDGENFHSKRFYKTIYRALDSANKHYKNRSRGEPNEI